MYKNVLYHTCVLFLLWFATSCSKDVPENNTQNTFREIYSGTYWQDIEEGLLSFAPEVIYYFYSPYKNPNCWYYIEETYENVDYGGCTYESSTFTVVSEDSDTLIAKETVAPGIGNTDSNSGTTCPGLEIYVTFQIINEEYLTTTFTYDTESGISESTVTLLRTEVSFPSEGCVDGTLNGYFW